MNRIIQFLPGNQDVSLAYFSTYDASLVAVSVLTAIFASFMAMELSDRILNATTETGKLAWLFPGALAMVGGVWSMHFIGMLAFSLPCGISYDPAETLLSMIPGVLASAAALWIMSQTVVSLGKLTLGGILMGGGIGAMHYSGMAAMRLDAVIYYSPALFTLSIGFAVIAAILSLHAKFALNRHTVRLSSFQRSALAAIIMGVAISGMHYIAMEAALFIPVDASSESAPGISPTVLAIGIGIITTMLVALAIAGSFLGRHLETINILEREIFTRKQTENELKESEERFRDFAEISSDWYWEQDEELKFTYISVSNKDISGILPEDHYGKTRRETNIGGVSEEQLVAHEKIMEGREAFEDFRFTRKMADGKVVYISIHGKPVFDQDGRFKGYRGTGTDITKDVAFKQLINAERDRAESANRAKSTFLANMSHEFRTPLNGIIGYLELLSTDIGISMSQEKRQNVIQDVHQASTHLLELINDILDLSRIEAGMEETHRESIDLGTVISRCIGLVQPGADKKDIGINNHLPDEIPPVWADEKHLRQILMNILSNAVKYTNDGGSVDIKVLTEKDNVVSVIVEDTGIGISEEDQLRIFETFERVHDKLLSDEGGTGLGLSLARKLIELNGGSIRLKSEAGVGTRIEMRFTRTDAFS